MHSNDGRRCEQHRKAAVAMLKDTVAQATVAKLTLKRWTRTPTQEEHGVLAMMKAPLKPGTRPVGAAQLAVEDTSTNGPVFAATVPRG